MAKRRTKLIAARIESGYQNQDSMVAALRGEGADISANTYANIESGRNKCVDVVIALAISRLLNKQVGEIFLDTSTQKIHRGINQSNSETCATVPDDAA